MGRIVAKSVRARMEQNVPMLMVAAFVIKDGKERTVQRGCVLLDFMGKRVKIVASAMRTILKCKYLSL